ncbi:helix-turn-helix domain-containing protein [Pseudomonas sp.]|uniref:helix-turn-helix domain-containing protein n=1 Tax=Pseudomonas sp. TaxID=306 RepID=UPI0025887CB5|nr:helix-turn-helix domain-containing protein [Pseudomonas sp.]
MSSPLPEEIRAAREASGLSQTAAAELVHSKLRTWQQWEAGDRKMHPGLWELFRLKTHKAIDISEPVSLK